MREHLEANRRHWDELVPIHERSAYYDVEAFKAGASSLHSLEVEELGDVAGKTLLHLQCHFGLDTLSWARRGAIVTGVDFSPVAIAAARGVAAKMGLEARFVESTVYELPDVLEGEFDIVFTSYGVLFWLPDVVRWAEVVAHFLRPGGTFYMAEFHPVGGMLDHAADSIVVSLPYFSTDEPLRFEDDGSYADREANLANRTTYSWPHPIGDVVTALIGAGLGIEFVHELPYSVEQQFPFMEKRDDGYYHMPEGMPSVPLLYSIRAQKRGSR